jgi:hypothetical protein
MSQTYEEAVGPAPEAYGPSFARSLWAHTLSTRDPSTERARIRHQNDPEAERLAAGMAARKYLRDTVIRMTDDTTPVFGMDGPYVVLNGLLAVAGEMLVFYANNERSRVEGYERAMGVVAQTIRLLMERHALFLADQDAQYVETVRQQCAELRS